MLVKVASLPLNVLITARPSSLRMPLNSDGNKSPVTTWSISSSSLAMPIRSLKPLIMCGALRFGVSRSVFLRHSARLYNVSKWAARLATSFGFAIAVTSSCQFRSQMAPALPCRIEGESNVSDHISRLPHLLVHEDGDFCRHVRKSRLAVLCTAAGLDNLI